MFLYIYKGYTILVSSHIENSLTRIVHLYKDKISNCQDCQNYDVARGATPLWKYITYSLFTDTLVVYNFDLIMLITYAQLTNLC